MRHVIRAVLQHESHLVNLILFKFRCGKYLETGVLNLGRADNKAPLILELFVTPKGGEEMT